VSGLIAAYAADELPPDVRALVAAHLPSCAACQQTLRATRDLRRRMANLRAEARPNAAPSLVAGVLEALAAAPITPPTANPGGGDPVLPPARPVLLPDGVLSPEASEQPNARVASAAHMRYTKTHMPNEASAHENHPDSIGRLPFIPLIAAAVVIILLGGFYLQRAGTHSQAGASHPNGAPATATSTILPATPGTNYGIPGDATSGLPKQGYLSSVAMLSATDGWAAGSALNDGGMGVSLLLHFTGGAWHIADQGVPNGELQGISMISPTEGWAVGDIFVNAQASALIEHYTNGVWRPVANPFNGNLHRVQFVSPTEGWAIGGDGESGNEFVLHYSGGQWTKSLTFQGDLHGLSFSGPNDGWISANGALYHYQNGHWNLFTTGLTGNPLAIAMTSANDGWASGSGAFTGSKLLSDNGGGIGFLRYDGAHWTVVPVTATGNSVYDINMVSATDGWAVGDGPPPDANQTRGSLLLHYTQGAWQQYAPRFDVTPNSVSMVSPQEGWAVGVSSVFNGANAPAILHFHNGEWSVYLG
jgi:hypothetical protein